ncbi:MAG: TlpA family protein disulfide reductase, partial [Rufibacter sp.]
TEANKQALRLQEKYKVAAFPTLLFVDATGKVVHKSVGYAGENKLLQLARQALGTDNFAAWNKQLEAGDVKAEAVLKLLEVEEKPEVYLEQGYQCRAQQILDKYFAAILAADYTKDINWHLVERFVADPHSAIFQYVVEHQQEFSKEFGAEHVNRKLFNTYLATTYGNTSTDRYRKAIKEIEISSVPQAKLVVEYRRLQELFYTAKKEQKWQAFVEQSSPFVEQYYYLLDTHLLNTWVSELAKANPTNKSILSSLNKWLAQVTANSYLDDYDILVTHANVQFKLGDKANARKNQQAAITLARQQDTDSAEIAEMEKQLRRYQ